MGKRGRTRAAGRARARGMCRNPFHRKGNPMETKPRLNLDALRVESFQTVVDGEVEREEFASGRSCRDACPTRDRLCLDTSTC
jgi:hypothetical protein